MVVTIIDDMVSAENITVAPGSTEIIYRKINETYRGTLKRVMECGSFSKYYYLP